jgi:hypothetical protein
LRKRETALLVALALLICYALTRSPSQFTELRYRCIRQGMSSILVSIILGGPPGDYTSGPTLPAADGGGVDEQWLAKSGSYRLEKWSTDTGLLIVQFGDNNDVTLKRFEPLQRLPQTFGDNLDWRWNRWYNTRHPVRE